MKKILISLLLVAVLTVGMLSLTACDEEKIIETIGAEAAKAIALADVNVTVEQVAFVGAETEVDNGVTYYDVEFTVDGVKYEYKVDATSGAVSKIEINDQIVPPEAAPTPPTAENNEYIGLEAAKAKALTDAQISADNAVFTEAHYDYDNGMYLYELEFVAGGVKYEYEIKATDGAVYKKEVDNIVTEVPAAGDVTYKTAEEIKTVIATDLNVLVADITFTELHFDRDNGVRIYDVELILADRTYEYEINAVTGAVISKDYEGSTLPASDNYISVDAAKATVLAHAGLTVSQITAYTCETDVDNGTAVYEIEFKSGGYEYEYKVNAETGAIIKVDKELD